MAGFSNRTIAAVSSALSESGIGIIRVSGPDSVCICRDVLIDKRGNAVLDKMEPSSFRHCYVRDEGELYDECIVLLYRAPYSYTGEDTVEIQCHGGVLLLRKILELILKKGALLAQPGEFTRRAFLNGKLDLTQAEAVMGLISSKSEMSLKISQNQMRGSISEVIKDMRARILYETAYIESAIDDPEHYDLTGHDEEVKKLVTGLLGSIRALKDSYNSGKYISEGIVTCIAGRPNSGKSSLLNLLTGQDRAIVSDIPGTTRDTIEEYIRLDDILLKLTDTAGIRKTDDPIESIGAKKALDTAGISDLVLFMIDASDNLTEDDEDIFKNIKDKKVIIILNKADLNLRITRTDIYDSFAAVSDNRDTKLSEDEFFRKYPCIEMSAKSGVGVDVLKAAVRDMFFTGKIKSSDEAVITSVRHMELLARAEESLENVLKSIEDGFEEDMYSVDLTDAYRSLGLIIGEEIGDDLADEIFSKFCLGK